MVKGVLTCDPDAEDVVVYVSKVFAADREVALPARSIAHIRYLCFLSQVCLLVSNGEAYLIPLQGTSTNGSSSRGAAGEATSNGITDSKSR
jgi:hypothetical protein